MKIGLYFNNKGIENVDLRFPEKGNPGVGGTQFNILTLAYYYNRQYKDSKIVLMVESLINLPDEIIAVKVSNENEAIEYCSKNAFDIYVYVPAGPTLYKREEIFKDFEGSNLKVIAWAHNTPQENVLGKIVESPNIKRVICVGNEQKDRIRDHEIIYKTEAINNLFCPKPYIPNDEVEKKKSVVYLGSLVPEKGFHMVAKIWKKVLMEVPDAKLHVIGSGKLYNRNSKLGKYDIADEKYENQFMPYLLDDNGKLLKSVIFHGVLGKEKIDIIQSASVAISNPTGSTENCPGSSIEMQACGTYTIAANKQGFLDTINKSGSGILIDDKEELKLEIIKALLEPKSTGDVLKYALPFINKEFGPNKVVCQWNKLFLNVLNNKKLAVSFPTKNIFKESKLKREFMRLTKLIFPKSKKIPPIRFLSYNPSWKNLLYLIWKSNYISND
ncbi:glycosyltransferase family 4 protein [Mangrovimonas sp. TPBH4]|uniref:glycosyltransferase family 4 protein n=1 Tax=Mangrovimonas sp. TPBH4 TaxID=1645914 RepID=UPI0006B51380|nr:glycosyltransferase [Mangrovimonas sp. TPBH4]